MKLVINNMAFEYQLEGRCQEAISLFWEAERLFKRERCDFQHANARANYWICRFANSNIEGRDLHRIEREIHNFAGKIGHPGAWFGRKTLILLAKIEEMRGNLDKAANLVKKAIWSGRNSGTHYPAIDTIYLNYLRNRIRGKENII